jgi:hypothetical protein
VVLVVALPLQGLTVVAAVLVDLEQQQGYQ